MSRFSQALVLVVSLAGCSEDSPASAAAGGAGTGGVTSVAGATASGGRAGMSAGGTAPSAGSAGTAGAAQTPASGGRSGAGTGGLMTTGGTTASGGLSSTGGVLAGGTASGGTTSNGGIAGAAGEGGAGGGGAGGADGEGGEGPTAKCGPVTEVPEAVRTRLNLDPFYEKHVDANGVSVLSSAAPDDAALLLACELLQNMLGERDDVRAALIQRRARFAIIGKNEGTADIPEYGYRDGPQEDIDYINERARGLGGIVASCGEENILCLDGDRYFNESICVHEFAHTISMYGVFSVDDGFEDELGDAFDAAMQSGILEGTYRGSNDQEYWAEGVQDWYDTNASSNPPNGVHNSVNTRSELADYDPALYALISGVFPEATEWGDCHRD